MKTQHIDPILQLISDIDDAKIELEELQESGDLEEVFTLALEIEDMEQELTRLRCSCC